MSEWDSDECECVYMVTSDCMIGECESGSYPDFEICECVEACPGLICSREGFISDFNECKCIEEEEEMMHSCEDVPRCPPNSIFDYDRCVCAGNTKPCDKVCPDFLGLVLNENTCECIDDCPEKDDESYCTREGFYYSCIQNKCIPNDECDIEQCPDHMELDEENCQCQDKWDWCDIKCPEFLGLIVDQDSCTCVSIDCEPKECPIDTYWCTETCQCRNVDEMDDDEPMECSENMSCPPGTLFNDSTC